MQKIFVSIASYRDPELIPTIEDCIKNAKYPENLVFGIGWQHCNEDKWDTLKKYKKDKRFRILDIDYKDAKGVCWVRSLIQDLYQNEDYYFQLDSHHRFVEHWDVKLMDILNYLRNLGHYKPLISGYVPSYFPAKDPEDRINEVWLLNIDRFLPEGAVFLRPQGLDGWRDMKQPPFSRFISGHFIFTIGSFVKEVPYDPNLYFHGEETSLAARAYTWGYDIFNPHRVYVWHEYTREGKKKHWDDNSFSDLDLKSYARFRKLFGMNKEDSYRDNKEEFGKHWFGPVRSLEDYEKYAGLKFKTRQVHSYTLAHKEPPTQGDYESGLCSKIKVCIDVYKGSIPEKDYDFFAVALLDKDAKDVYRQDADKTEIQRLLNEDPKDKFIHIWREYESTDQPHSWRVWPHTESGGWKDKIEQTIRYE